MIRLKDGSDCLMITNDDHERGNENVALIGGVWDMHNEGQSLAEYQKTRNWKGAYEPARYLGVLMRFNRVKRLTLRGLTLKDPVTFSTQLGNLEEFTIEDIAFDHNLKRTNMDGIHVHGNSRHGRITNLKGATNDDLVALNADDGGIFEMSRGPIEDVVVDGVWAKDGYTGVRLLSAGSPIRRIRLAKIFGSYRYNVVSFTNHKVHPGTASTFEDISIHGL
nr:glycoside hydrolase family 28 protein [Pirellulaceae bacterium]